MNRTAVLLGCLLAAGCGAKPGATHREPGGQPVLPEPVRRGTFTIGPDTTVVDGPLLPTGQIDYNAAVNERLAKGVTPETNAVVLIWQALGPNPPGWRPPDQLFERLGMAAPPSDGSYFVTHDLFREGNSIVIHAGLAVLRRPWTGAEFPDVADWLERNAEALGLVIEATKRPGYYSPVIASSNAGEAGLVNSRLPTAQPCRVLGAALVARAMLRTGEGKADDAWQDLRAAHRLARLVGRGGTLIENLVGSANELLVCQADLAFLEHTRPTAAQARGYLADLGRLPPPPRVADGLDRFERLMMLDFIMQIDRYGLKALGPGVPDNAFGELALDGIDWDPALRTANEWTDRFVAALRHPTRAERTRAHDQAITDIRALKVRASQPDALAGRLVAGVEPTRAKGEAVGDILVTLLFPATGKVQDASDRAHQAYTNVTVALALAAYRHDHGRYPETLAALAPKYLDKLPGDVFSGEDLHYVRTKGDYLLYSVGVDGEDDGGRGPDDDPPGDDLAVRVPQPKGR